MGGRLNPCGPRTAHDHDVHGARIVFIPEVNTGRLLPLRRLGRGVWNPFCSAPSPAHCTASGHARRGCGRAVGEEWDAFGE